MSDRLPACMLLTCLLLWSDCRWDSALVRQWVPLFIGKQVVLAEPTPAYSPPSPRVQVFELCGLQLIQGALVCVRDAFSGCRA